MNKHQSGDREDMSRFTEDDRPDYKSGSEQQQAQLNFDDVTGPQPRRPGGLITNRRPDQSEGDGGITGDNIGG